MKDEIHSTSINPDVVEQFLALMNTHCKSSEEALTMLSTERSPHNFPKT